MRRRALQATVAVVTLALTTPIGGQEKPRIPPQDYGRFERLGGFRVAPDGAFVAYGISRVDGAVELRVRPVAGAEADERTFAEGRSPSFSADGRWVAWTIGLPEAERDRLRAAEEPLHEGVGLLELAGGDERTFEKTSGYTFDATGRYLALIGYPPAEPEGKGADLRVLDLEAGTETTFGNVAEYVWSDVDSLLAMAVATGAEAGNGVQLYDASGGVLRALDSSDSTYRALSWREDAPDLAVIRSVEAGAEPGDRHEVLAWRGLAGAEVPAPQRLHAGTDGLSDDPMIVAHRSPTWSESGARIAFGLRPAAATAESPTDPTDENEEEAEGDETTGDDEDPELPGLQIWHTSDVDLYPAQAGSADRSARRTLLAVWHLDEDRAVMVGTDLDDTAELLGDFERAIERSSRAHAWGDMFGRPYQDVWLIDTATGERRLLLERVRYAWTGPDDRWLVTFDGNYHAVDLATGEPRNLTGDLDAEFANVRYDTPTDLLPPWWFFPTWSREGDAVLVVDRWDVWRLDLEGGATRRLTDGAAREIEHRILDLDEEPGVDLDDTLWFSMRGEASERRGIARLEAGADAAEELLWGDAMFGSLARAEEADVHVYRAESRTDSPDLFATDPDFTDPVQITATNPFADEYAWGRVELVDFESEWGEPLQAGLIYPANHDPSRRYPMIVYTYEILAPQIHFWEAPGERDYYNFTAWSQAGYFVLMPDIRYRAREPGPSAIAAVRPAVQAIVERGLADADRVGLIGHSWGGYQATYLPTRVDTFAASVAGAPLTDFVSFMGALHWNPGMAELSHWETGQARMEVPYWEDPEAHHRSSPVHEVHNMDTPLLMAFGDADGVVDWDQGTEFFNFARRAGKQMVLLVYEGEDHGFREEANQIDYHRRILEWFGHFLKGEPAPAWITEGVAYEELEEEKRRVATQR